MTVYEGVLRKYSGGPTMPGRWTRREFVDLGEQRIKYVALSSYHDELLKESLGREIALSTYGSRRQGLKRVVAMRTERGLDRCGRGFLVGSFIANWFVSWLLALILGVCMLFVVPYIGQGVGLLFGQKEIGGYVGVAVVGAVFLFLVFRPFIIAVRQWHAWGALRETSGQHSRVLTGT